MTSPQTTPMNPEVAELLTELNLLELKIRQEIFFEIFKEEIPESNTDDIYGFALEAARNCAAKEMFPDRPDLKGSGLSAAIQERAMEETGEVDTEKVRTRQLDYMVASHKICNRLCDEYNQKLGDARMAFFTQNVEGVKYTAKAQALNDRLMQEGRANLKTKTEEFECKQFKDRQVYKTRCCSEGMPYHSALCLPGIVLTCDSCSRQFPMSLDLTVWMDCDENFDVCQSCMNCIDYPDCLEENECRYCEGRCYCE